MNGRLQILVPMAGGSPFFNTSEHFFPKPLTDILGKPMIEHVVTPLRAAGPNARFIFLVREEDVARFSLDAIIRLCVGDEAVVIPVAGSTQGSLCSALLAIDALNLDDPLLISNGDQVLDVDYAGLLRSLFAVQADAAVATFPSIHPRWSYVKLDAAGYVIRAAEKRVISNNAIAGLYFFRSAGEFIAAAQATILSDDRVDNSFYIAPCLNQIILKNKLVACVPVPAEAYHSFYSPGKVDDYVSLCNRGALSHPVGQGRVGKVVVVIPAAGQGSRFASAGWRKPKPFIDVAGKPMIERVMENAMPVGSRCIVLLRQEHMDVEPGVVAGIRGRAQIVPVEKLTEGTLCTLLLARKLIAPEDSILVVNSDQLVDFSVDAFVNDCLDRDLDGSILVFRDKQKDPKWSFAKVGDAGLVTAVAEKVAISDLATVGMYFFRRADAFISAAIDMIVANDRVNNEFYTCPVYNYMIADGARIGVYEVPMDAMHGLGIPADLTEYMDGIGAAPSADRPVEVA